MTILYLAVPAGSCAALPAFAESAGFERLDRPFSARLELASSGAGDARLTTRLSLPDHTRPVLVHWEVAADRRFRSVERYGLVFAHPEQAYEVGVTLRGLAPGCHYWARMWAGGSWSPSVRTETGSRTSERRDAQSRARHAAPSRPHLTRIRRRAHGAC